MNHMMHTKNWKPLSVNRGASLSLYKCTYTAHTKYKIWYTHTYTTNRGMYMTARNYTNKREDL
jgi:hypothetical protein